jgi:hypothetical protein
MEPGQDDNPKVGLVQQMRNFLVLRVSSTGQPVYSQDYEHTLTAWMLAMLGFQIEWGGLSLQPSSSRVSFGGAFGEKKAKDARSRFGVAAPISRRETKPRSRTTDSEMSDWEEDGDGMTWRKIAGGLHRVAANHRSVRRQASRDIADVGRRYTINKRPRRRKM